MAFTRNNIGQTSTFERSGATTFASTPNFQVFEVVNGTSNFSLNNKWTLHTELGSNPNLKFKYNGTTLLEITSSGLGNIVMPSLKLSENSALPNYVGYNNGDVVKVQGHLYVLTGGSNSDN